MGDDFKNINFLDVDIEQYNSMDITFSKEEKEDLKKKLRKKIAKRKSKRNGFAVAVVIVLITVVLVSNGNSVLANVLPTFNKLYESLGFKSKYLSQSVYIGKTYEENGIKVTLDNLVGTNHVVKVALKVQYSDKWAKLNRPLVHFIYGFDGKLDTGSFGGLQNIDENTELIVLDFTSEEGFPCKGDFQIKALSDGFKNSIVWDMNVDFSKNFKETIEKEVTMSKNIGVNINYIEINTLGTIINSNSELIGYTYYIKVGDKIYPIFGGAWNSKEGGISTIVENVPYDVAKNSKHIYLVKHDVGNTPKINTKEITKEESIKNGDNIRKQLEDLPKGESKGIIYTKKIAFNNGNKAEIYNVERVDGKIRIYIKGDDKKQVFNMLSNLYTSTGELVQCIWDNGVGYIAEFNDISKDKVAIKMIASVLECSGNYTEDESEITLK